MASDQLKAFLLAFQGDTYLQDKLRGVTDPDFVISIAKEAGYIISVEELFILNDGSEISDEELEDVAGGYYAVSARCMQF